MEATTVAASALPSRAKFLSCAPPPASSPPTVPAKSVASGSLVVRHHSNSFSEEHGQQKNHVVKILINPKSPSGHLDRVSQNADLAPRDRQTDSVVCDVAPCVRISVNSDSEMIENHTMAETTSSFFCYGPYNCGVKSSGQISPFSDTPDSGTCSDLDGAPPPLPKKKGDGISITLIESHKRAPSSSSGAEVDSDDDESNISCDSLNSGKISPVNIRTVPASEQDKSSSYLPQLLLQDIRQRNKKLSPAEPSPIIIEKSYEERKLEAREEKIEMKYTADMFYNFHINEHVNNVKPQSVIEDETFAGYKDMLNDGAATIRSAKGTVRGVKNRVRAGIATFLQIHSTGKNYKEKEAGKVVVYTTTMGIVRETYQACMKVKQILRTLLVKYEERDVFMSSEYQAEIQERMQCKDILVPQMFVDGQHIGDAETIERLNESGELRRILKPFKSMDVCTTCKVCGGFRLLPCQICNGSKKSVHRNHFTAEFVALKCMNCDEVGLVRCNSCS